MTDAGLRRSAELFEAALREPEQRRASFLREACGSDAEILAEVEALLEHHERASGFLSSPAFPPETGELRDLRQQTLGRYRLLERLGAGGMGVVYLAEQESPRRKVALKLLRPGFATPEMLSRFTHEAQFLGRLHHPGIAQIYEAVASDTGEGPQPYFAMEYVEGRALLDYARERGLSLHERLRLFVAICEAVQHAHQKGVLHRDLKPANILVDGSGNPKILDFGVARAIDPDVRAGTLHTHAGEIIGTLGYMSPEQAAGNPSRLDTRSDVYALGVVCYELLAGRPPHDLRDAPLHEALRVICNTEPTPLGAVRRELRGDLETIVAKALEKEPERRYASASELARDIERYLCDEPIAARPASTLYQLGKFARRNRGLVTSVASVVLLLAAAVAVTGRLALRLAEQRDAALALEREADRQRAAAQESRSEALEQAEVATAVSGFLEDVLGAAEPYVADRDTTVADAVRWASEEVDERFAERPEIAAALRQRLASIHYSRGELDRALAQSRASLEVREQTAAEDPLALAASLTSNATMLQVTGDLEEAERALREAFALYERHAPEDPALWTTLTTLGAVLQERGAFAEAEPLLRRALEGRLREHGPEHPYTLTSRNNLAMILLQTGRQAEAEPLLREIMEISRRALTTKHPNTIAAIFNYANALRELDRLEEAEPLLVEAIQLGQEHLPAGHWIIGLYRSRYGELLLQMDRPDAAETELLSGFHQLETALGVEHDRTQRVVRALIQLHEARGDSTALAEWRARLAADATR